MKLKPWYDVVKPREDLRENKPLDASEFAVHLDQIRDDRQMVDVCPRLRGRCELQFHDAHAAARPTSRRLPSSQAGAA